MSSIDIQVTGLPETIAAIESLPDGIRQNVIMKAVRQALEPIYASALNYVPVLYGFLKDHITRKSYRAPDEKTFVGMVGIMRGGEFLDVRRKGPKKGEPLTVYPATYGTFVELGTSTREATPFLRPALDAQASNAANLFAITAEQAMEDLVERSVYGGVTKI